jgi:hypothetical protein
MNAHHWRRAVAAREVITQEMLDHVLVENLHSKSALCHPMGEVGNASDVAFDRIGSVTATPQVRGERIEVWRERASEKPCLGRSVKRNDEVHDGLQ